MSRRSTRGRRHGPSAAGCGGAWKADARRRRVARAQARRAGERLVSVEDRRWPWPGPRGDDRRAASERGRPKQAAPGPCRAVPSFVPTSANHATFFRPVRNICAEPRARPEVPRSLARPGPLDHVAPALSSPSNKTSHCPDPTYATPGARCGQHSAAAAAHATVASPAPALPLLPHNDRTSGPPAQRARRSAPQDAQLPLLTSTPLPLLLLLQPYSSMAVFSQNFQIFHHIEITSKY